MTSDPTSITADKTAMDVSEVFNSSVFHHLPVVSDEGRVIGIVSRTDLDQHSIGMSLFANTARQEQTEALFQTLIVEYFMTKTPIILSPDDTIQMAYEIFRTHNFRAIPITAEDILVGIVTPIDLAKPFLCIDEV